MNSKKIDTYWDETTNTASCLIVDNYDREYMGFAYCNPEDIDMASEKTGCTIAERRATIAYLQGYIKNELKPKLRGLKQLYYSINRSKIYNKRSYEARKLRRHIFLTNKEINEVKEEISKLKEDLNTYIAEKDKFYKKIRIIRQKAKTE